MNKTSRYQRQIILEEIGTEGQEKLFNASVLCVGAGGLGCPALLYLAAAGVGHIGIADFDCVEESNLQRQTLYTTEQIGQNKALAAQQRLKAFNPEIEVHTYSGGLNNQNIEKIFTRYDLIIDATDNFASKYLINDAAVKFSKPFIYGALQGFQGQISVFNYTQSACYRCLYPHPPKEHIPTCAENGVIGAVAGIIGTMQAMEAVKIIVGDKSFKPLYNELFCIDLRTIRTQKLNINKDQNCTICSKTKEEIALPENRNKSVIEQIMPDNIQTGAYLIDVREQHEWDDGFIDGAVHIPLSQIAKQQIPELPNDTDIVLYCAAGVRSQQAAEILREQGYQHLKNMSGGYLAWLQAQKRA